MVSLWSIIGMFAWLEYRNLKQYRVEALSNRVAFAVTNILTGHEEDLNRYEFLDFFESSIADSPVASLRMSIYDKRTGKWLYHMGRPARLDEKEVPEPHGAVVTTSSPCRISRTQCWLERFVRTGRASMWNSPSATGPA